MYCVIVCEWNKENYKTIHLHKRDLDSYTQNEKLIQQNNPIHNIEVDKELFNNLASSNYGIKLTKEEYLQYKVENKIIERN